MIVRVQSQGQYRLAAESVAHLQEMDSRLVAAVNGDDADGMHRLLTEVVSFVQAEGRPVGLEELVPSELILPAPDATLDEVRAVLREDGLIPG